MNTAPTPGPLDDLDLAILAELREALETADPMPADLDERVRFALTVQALRAEIAELERVPAEPVGVRTVDYTRVHTVTFTSESLTAVVTITPLDHESARLDGWVEGAAREVEIRERSRAATTGVDKDGRFAFPKVERGLAQFVFRLDGDSAAPVITPALEI
jgi:hypothetical protein